MKTVKKCKYCKRDFTTDKNAKKFCSVRCSVYFNKRKNKKVPDTRCMCQWCADIFESKTKNKFCSKKCLAEYKSKTNLILKKVKKVKVKLTINDALKKCKEEKISYGRYISLHKLK